MNKEYKKLQAERNKLIYKRLMLDQEIDRWKLIDLDKAGELEKEFICVQNRISEIDRQCNQ